MSIHEPTTKTFEITASPGTMKKIERFLALLHWNSRHGHSGIFGMSFDGDGNEGVTVNPTPDHKSEVGSIASYGYEYELAGTNKYWGRR